MAATPASRSQPGDGSTDVRLTLVGGFDLRLAGEPVALPASARRLVAYVALLGRPATRSHLASMLWLDTTEDRALANLRSALWRLRRPGVSIVEAANDRLRLSNRVSVDLHELFGLARLLLAGVDDVGSLRVEALTGDCEILPGWFDDWVLMERERFRQLRLHALERLAKELARAGEYGRAVDAGLAAVADEPLRESAHRVLVETHLGEGNRIEALRQFDAYRRLMRDELGLAPSEEMLGLVRPIMAPPPVLDPSDPDPLGGSGVGLARGGAPSRRSRWGDG